MSTAGIPRVQFDEDPVKLILPSRSLEDSILYYRELTQKYRFLEANIEERLQRTEAKRDELAKNLSVVSMLQRAAEKGVKKVQVDFEIGDSMMVRGEVEDPSTVKVHLWLSPAAMVAYDLVDAEKLLAERLKETNKTIGVVEEEQKFLKNQITTAEVNMARLYNHHLALTKK